MSSCSYELLDTNTRVEDVNEVCGDGAVANSLSLDAADSLVAVVAVNKCYSVLSLKDRIVCRKRWLEDDEKELV